VIAEEAGRHSWPLSNPPKPPEMTFATGGDMFARCPDNTRTQCQFQYAARAAHQASDLSQSANLLQGAPETRFAQEISVPF
jgi:hypothetical protein